MPISVLPLIDKLTSALTCGLWRVLCVPSSRQSLQRALRTSQLVFVVVRISSYRGKKKIQSMSTKALTGRQLTRSDSDIRKGLASLLLEGVINDIYIYEQCPGGSNLLNSTSQT